MAWTRHAQHREVLVAEEQQERTVPNPTHHRKVTPCQMLQGVLLITQFTN